MIKATSLVALIAALMVLLPGPVYKYGLLELGPAFMGLRYGVYVGLLAFVLVIIQVLFFRKSLNWFATVFAVVCIAISIGIPVSMKNKASAVPAIHDITTDLINPPEFVAVLTDRQGASNPAEYAGEDVAKQQREAYPDLTAQTFSASEQQVKAAAQAVVKDFGWQIHSNAQGYNVEATHQSAWFGFKDDVVIRIVSKEGITRVDVRSKSRVGRSDLGANAERIKQFQIALAKKLS